MVVITQWHTLVAALWISLACGYWGTFGTFSPALKEQYGLDPGDLTTIGIGTTVVGFITFTTGMYTDRVGVRTSLLTGAIINMLGWFLYGVIAVNDLRPMPPVVMFTALAIFATYGAGMLTGAVFKVVTTNFTEGRSTVVGIAKAWVGVTSGTTSMIYVSFFPSDDNAPERLYFIWFLVANVAIFAVLPGPLMRIIGSDVRGNLAMKPRARVAYLLCVTLALILLTVILAIIKQDLSHAAALGISIVLMILLLLPWLTLLPSHAAQQRSDSPLMAANTDEPRPMQQPTAGSSEEQHEQNRLPSPWACGPLQMMKRVDSWLLWFSVFALMAGGVVLTTNFGDITASRTGAHVSSASAVAVFSGAQAFGRLSGGVISDILVGRKLPRPWYFVVLSTGMGVAHGILCISGPTALYVGTMLAGYAFGSTYPLMIVTIFELYGPERIASNYMVFDGTPVGVASLLVAKAFTQWVEQQHTDGDTCTGDSCFTLAYVGVIALQIASVASACFLAVRSAVVYRVSVFDIASGAEHDREKSHSLQAAGECDTS